MKNHINWEEYKKDLIAAIDNERLWMKGSLDEDEENMHRDNYEKLKKELDLINHGNYDAVLEQYPNPKVFNPFIER